MQSNETNEVLTEFSIKGLNSGDQIGAPDQRIDLESVAIALIPDELRVGSPGRSIFKFVWWSLRFDTKVRAGSGQRKDVDINYYTQSLWDNLQ